MLNTVGANLTKQIINGAYTVKLACMEFHTQHVPTADNLLVANFCKIGGSKSLDILEAYKYMWKENYEQSI